MRNSFNITSATYKAIALIICFLLVLIYNKSKANNNAESKKIHVKFIQLTNNAVSVEIRSGKNTVDLYLFSSEGRLEKNIKIINTEKKIISNLEKGTYLYQCFENDLQLQSGKLILK
ncbi:MAG: hypothetical protein WKF35_09630 [Ferruginibacter sp.]